MRYVLKHALPGETFLRINSGKKFVGRVWRHATTGRWHGKIGAYEGEGATQAAAFDEVAAHALGFSSAAAVHANNAAVRTHRKRQRQGAQLLVAGMMSGDRVTREKAFDVLLDVMSGEDVLAGRTVTRAVLSTKS